MPTHYLAIDLGASSGRLILGWLDDGVIRLEEIHRFKNGPSRKGERLIWDVDGLFKEILVGLKKAGAMNRRPKSLGLDTWGVDFALLDDKGALLGDVVCYRDSRTRGMMDAVNARAGEKWLYSRTGIQPLDFNTIFQLEAVRQQEPELLARARTCLMLPCYLNYLLTGVKKNEYTIASTSQLLNAETGAWDTEVFKKLGFPVDIFPHPDLPGTEVGGFSAAVREAVGYDVKVVMPPQHDTASAVLALPSVDDDSIYLSSGTWSLMGIELLRPDCRWECRTAGFTNEGGYGRRYRFLKNIMGMWCIQLLHKEMAPSLDFDGIVAMAKAGMGFTGIIDLSGPEFLMPESMRAVICEICKRDLGVVPATDEEVMACAYRSLAGSYAKTVRGIEELTGRTMSRVNIMGGGSNDMYLNRLTAEATGKDVYAGPSEATAIGNVVSQMLEDGVFSSLEDARRAVASSFAVKKV